MFVVTANYWSKNKRSSHAATDGGVVKQKKRGRKKLLTRCKNRGAGTQQEDDQARMEGEKPPEAEKELAATRSNCSNCLVCLQKQRVSFPAVPNQRRATPANVPTRRRCSRSLR